MTGAEDAGHGGKEREVRHAVMHSQFGWGVYAVCEYKAGERLGWYDGEEITAERWGSLGKHEGREHTIRTGWASKHTTQTVQCMNGIDGVAGMQYINTAYGRVEREQSTGLPEHTEKVRFRYNKGRVVVAVKEGLRIKAGEELRVAYGWTKAAWHRVREGEDGYARRLWSLEPCSVDRKTIDARPHPGACPSRVKQTQCTGS